MLELRCYNPSPIITGSDMKENSILSCIIIDYPFISIIHIRKTMIGHLWIYAQVMHLHANHGCHSPPVKRASKWWHKIPQCCVNTNNGEELVQLREKIAELKKSAKETRDWHTEAYQTKLSKLSHEKEMVIYPGDLRIVKHVIGNLRMRLSDQEAIRETAKQSLLHHGTWRKISQSNIHPWRNKVGQC